MRVTIRVLGALEVRIGDTAVDVGGPTQQALLALLASTADTPVPADAIASALWGSQLPSRHRQQVQKRVHLLRAKLGAESVVTVSGGYRLACRTDYDEFTRRLAHARALRSAEDLAEASDAYRSALALWRGPALDGIDRLPDIAARLDDLRGQATEEHQELGRPGPAALPLAGRTFVGREDVLATMSACGPLTVITGLPGVGKTALAIRWAHQADFPDGKFYLNLHGFDAHAPATPDEALRQLLHALGVAYQEIPRVLDDQIALYRSLLAGKRILIVLDNAADEEQVRPLLPPGCAAVVTSRNDLRGLVALDDAHRVALDVLTEAEACALVTSLTGTGDGASDLARLCGYLPLALRVAAASQTSAAALAGFTTDTPLLTAAFDLSYRTLPSSAARTFRLLGLVPRPEFTLRAASALLGDDAAAELEALERASVIERHRRDRYRMHDLLHAYARDQLSVVECAGALPRLLDHYLQTTDAASDLVAPAMTRQPRHTPVTFGSTAEASEWLDYEHQNVVAAALARPSGRTWQLADALRRHLWLMGRLDLALSLSNAGLAVAVTEQDLLGQAAMHYAIGTAHMTDDAERATGHFTAAADLFDTANAPESRLYALMNLSRCQSMRGRFADTITVLRTASGIASTPELRAEVQSSMGVVLTYSGRPAEALRHHEDELRNRAQTEDTVTLPATMLAIATGTRQVGLLDRSTAMTERMERMARGTGASQWRMHSLTIRSALARDTGQTAAAIALVEDLLSVTADAHGAPFEPAAHETLGQLYSHQGKHSQAVPSLEHAVRLANELQYGHLVAGMLVDLARAHLGLGDPVSARSHAEDALQDARSRDLPLQQGRALVTLAHLGSAGFAAQALELQEESGNLLARAEALLALGEHDRAGEIFARYTGDPGHAPAGVFTGKPCATCA